jgi:hypothetical protein
MSVTYSGVKFAACDKDDPNQKWDIRAPSGVGEIRDQSSGRCLSVLDCKNTQPASDPLPNKEIGRVVLDECDAGPCDGKNAQWHSVVTGPWTTFESKDIAASASCYTLNAVGDGGATTNNWPMVAWGAATCDPNAGNNQFKWDEDTGLLRVNFLLPLSSCTSAAECCLVAEPCVTPCHLVRSWGTSFLLVLMISIVVYIGGWATYSVKVLGKSASSPKELLAPHPEQWRAFAGLVADGVTFFSAQASAQLQIARGDRGPVGGSAERKEGEGYGSVEETTPALATPRAEEEGCTGQHVREEESADAPGS